MATGPVEYLVVGFPGNKFSGEIVPELAKLVESGTIRILDLLFVAKDDEGNVVSVEVEDDDALADFVGLEGEVGGFISEADIEWVADDIEPGSSIGILVWEDTWATPFVEALRNAGGVLIDTQRIEADLVEAALKELHSAD